MTNHRIRTHTIQCRSRGLSRPLSRTHTHGGERRATHARNDGREVEEGDEDLTSYSADQQGKVYIRAGDGFEVGRIAGQAGRQ